MQDGITICPECGRPVVKMKTSLGLKGENGKKPVQQRAYTPTDDYGDIYDGNSIGGTDPVKITKEDVTRNRAAEAASAKCLARSSSSSYLQQSYLVFICL